jgi:predicted negative regulator of RcsB-dependent stress response
MSSPENNRRPLRSPVQQLAGFVRRRQKGIVVGALAVGAVLVANFAWSQYSAQRDADARARFALVMSAFTQAVSQKSANEGFERVIIEAQKIRDEYPSSPVDQLARYYIAISDENLGNTERSVQHLRELIRDGDPTMKYLAQFALAAIYRNHGDTKRAMDVYKDIEESGVYSRPEGHSGHARPARPSGHPPSP